MKRNTLYAFFVTLALVFSGCGSNSLEDATGSGSATPTTGNITTSLQSITIDKNSGNALANVNVASTYASTVVATLSSMDITLGGCPLVSGSVVANPSTVTLDENASTKDVVLSGTMTDPTCIPTSYQLTGTNRLLENGETSIESLATDVIAIQESAITIEDSSQVTLSVVTQRLDINESGVSENITIRVLKGQVGEAGQNVIITDVSSVLGSFDSSTATSDAAGDAVFTYTSPSTIVDNNMTVEFCLEENTSICDTAAINLTTSAIVEPEEVIDNINYFITYVPNNGVNNLALGTVNNAIVTLVDKDTNEAIPSERVKSITVTSRDLSILKLAKESGGVPGASISVEDRNAISVLMTADKLNSGLAVIEIIIEYENLNGITKTRGQLFSVAVLSGEATAFSINDAGVGYNFETKQFEHKFIVQATDASSNPISTTGYINVSAMASFAKDASGREILYGRHSGGISATLTPNAGTATLELTGDAPFSTTNIKENRAFVAVFGDVETYEANGKWNLDEIISGNTLSFSNEYYGEAYNNLGMAVGYNYRDKVCTSTFEESVVVVDSTDGTYLLDENGQAFVTLKYDSYMIGKRAMILVNMTGLNPNTGEVQRSGEVHERTLSFNLPLKGDTISVPAGATNFPVGIWGTIDTGTEDEWGVYNSTFSCTLDLSEVLIVSGSYTQNDPASCDDNGRAFIGLMVNSTGLDGSVTFKDCQVDSERLF